MIVDDLYILSTLWCPDEADAPLLVNANAVLTPSIIFQRFECVAGRHPQIVKNCRPVQLCKLAERRSFNVHPALYALTLEKGLSFFALEVLDRHGSRY